MHPLQQLLLTLKPLQAPKLGDLDLPQPRLRTFSFRLQLKARCQLVSLHCNRSKHKSLLPTIDQYQAGEAPIGGIRLKEEGLTLTEIRIIIGPGEREVEGTNGGGNETALFVAERKIIIDIIVPLRSMAYSF